MVEEGKMAPDFKVALDDGSMLNLKALRGAPVVLYFYPKDDTSGCTRVAQDYTATAKDFGKLGVSVIGVSPDSIESHKKFRSKHKLAVHLGADEDRKVIEKYGVWVEKSMYGRKYMGVERATFLIGANGRIARIWRKVRVPNHAKEVLAAAKELTG